MRGTSRWSTGCRTGPRAGCATRRLRSRASRSRARRSRRERTTRSPTAGAPSCELTLTLLDAAGPDRSERAPGRQLPDRARRRHAERRDPDQRRGRHRVVQRRQHHPEPRALHAHLDQRHGRHARPRGRPHGRGGDHRATSSRRPLRTSRPERTRPRPRRRATRCATRCACRAPTRSFTNVRIYDELDALNALPAFVPGTLNLVSWPAGADVSNTSSTGGAKGTGVIDIRNLNVATGGQIQIQFDVTLAATLPVGTVVTNQSALRLANNTPRAVSDDPNVNGPADPDVAGDEDPTRVVIAPTALVFEKTVANVTSGANPAAEASPGDRLRYRLRLENLADFALSGADGARRDRPPERRPGLPARHADRDHGAGGRQREQHERHRRRERHGRARRAQPDARSVGRHRDHRVRGDAGAGASPTAPTC